MNKITFITDRRVKPNTSLVGIILKRGNLEVTEGNRAVISARILEPQYREHERNGLGTG
jgi:hypothetical protein